MEENHSSSENSSAAVNTHSPPPHSDREPPPPDPPLPKPPLMAETKVNGITSGGDVEKSGSGWRSRSKLSILGSSKKEGMVKMCMLGFRVFGSLFCLISFSVMAADQNMGWALDSFSNYKQFRYCISVNVIGFVYSALQTCNLAYKLISGKQTMEPQFLYYFDFVLDQIMAYLLMSASSSAATRADDWKSDWGDDKFPDMASASVGISFIAFLALAFSSLLSGYTLCFSLKYT